MGDIEVALRLMKEGKIEESLALFEELIQKPDLATQARRERSIALAGVGRYASALRDREALLDLEPEPRIGDAYLAGEYALEKSAFERAIALFARAIELSQKRSDAYYLSESRLLKAYCHAKLGDTSSARRELDFVSDQVEITWTGMGPISKATVMRLLEV